MGEEEFIIWLVAIVFGTGLVGFFFWNIFSFAKRKQEINSSELDPQFFRALAEFKRTTEKRLNNLEAIVTDDEKPPVNTQTKKPTGSIEIEDDEIREDSSKSGNNLRNMLNE